MFSWLLGLWPLWRWLLDIAFICFWMLCAARWLPWPLVLAGGCLLVLNFGWQQIRWFPWLLRLVIRTRRFRTAPGRRVVLRYARELRGQVDPRVVLDMAEKTLGELEAIFGRLTFFWHGGRIGPLLFRRRVYVYLFPTGHSVDALFGKDHWGASLPPLYAVAVSFDGVWLHEQLKHELRHLFSDRCNQLAPLLLNEGLASWLQGTWGYHSDEAAAACLRQENCRLRSLFDQENFFAFFGSYALASSFSGFLIRKFGSDAYGRFYRQVRTDQPFDPPFNQHFGMTLEEAEQQWRQELPKQEKPPHEEEWWVYRFD